MFSKRCPPECPNCHKNPLELHELNSYLCPNCGYSKDLRDINLCLSCNQETTYIDNMVKYNCSSCGYEMNKYQWETWLKDLNNANGNPFYKIRPVTDRELDVKPRIPISHPPASAVLSVIQPNLHFIYVGKPPSYEAQLNVVRWAEMNPNYTIYIWTDLKKYQFNAFYRSVPGPMYFAPTNRTKNNIVFKNINEIGSVANLYETNPVAMSDVLRLNILYKFGGGYMDIDIAPSDISLPEDYKFYMPPDINLLTSVRNGITENQIIFVNNECPAVCRVLQSALLSAKNFYSLDVRNDSLYKLNFDGRTHGYLFNVADGLAEINSQRKPGVVNSLAKQEQVIKKPIENRLAYHHFIKRMSLSEQTGYDKTHRNVSIFEDQEKKGLFDDLTFTEYRSKVDAYCKPLEYWQWFKQFFSSDTDYGDLNSWLHPHLGDYKRQKWGTTVIQRAYRNHKTKHK